MRLGLTTQVIKLLNVIELALATGDDPLSAVPTPLMPNVASAATTGRALGHCFSAKLLPWSEMVECYALAEQTVCNCMSHAKKR